MESGYWFKSTLFEIENNEDEETNPGCYGKALASWLSDEFSKLGYETDIIPEDWGWCVMLKSDEYMLWLGCGSMQDDIEGQIPKGSEVIWHTFPVIEVPFFNFKALLKKWFGKLDLQTPLNKLKGELRDTLLSTKQIEFCEEP